MPIQFLPPKSYPQNNEDEFPVGQELIFVFSEAVDLKKIKESIVLYGPSFDRTSGPNNALWLNTSSGENPFFLKSPGFKGFVDYDVRMYLVESTDLLTPIANQVQLNKATSQPVAVIVTPKAVLGESTAYSSFIVGSNVDNFASLPEAFRSISVDRALTSRTVFDAFSLDANGAEVDEIARIKTYGSFEPLNEETNSTVNIKLLTSGNGSSAEYKWWFSDEAEPQPAQSNYSARVSKCVQRWRKLARGVLVKFSASDYTANEVFQIRCFERSSLATSYAIDFQTGTGSIYEYPENTSSSPIGVGNLVIPSAIPGVTIDEALKVISVTPGDGSINNDLALNKIRIEFNKNLDATTLTQESVKITTLPVSGVYDGNAGASPTRETKVYKIISVSNNILTLEL